MSDIEMKDNEKPKRQYPEGTKRPNRSSKYASHTDRSKHYYEVRREKYAATVVRKYFMKLINSKNKETKEELQKLMEHLQYVYENHIDLTI